MKQMLLCSTHELIIDCFVDGAFAGPWNVEDPHDPLCVKSRTGYVLMVGKCPVHWVSKLQSEVGVSMMEAEYIALSTAMQDLIPLQTLVSEVCVVVAGSALSCWTYSKVFKDNNGTLILVTSTHDPGFQTYCHQVSFFQGTHLLGSYTYSQGLQ